MAASLILQPLPWRRVSLAGLLLVATTAAYCFTYTWLAGGYESPWLGIGWAAANLLPWLLAFEAAKRNRRPAAVAGIVALAASGSILLENVLAIAAIGSGADLLFQLVRRVPGAVVLLLLLAAGSIARRRSGDRSRAVAEPLPLLPNDIDWVAAAGNYVEIHSRAGTLLRRMTMAEAEALLAPQGFVRIHRSWLVNRARIAQVRLGKPADEIELSNGRVLKVGAAYRATLVPRDSAAA